MDVDSINVVSNTEATEPIIAVDEEKRHREMFNNHNLKLLDDGKINKIMKQFDYDDSIKLMEKVTEITKENRNRYYYLINEYQILKIGETKRLVKKTKNKTGTGQGYIKCSCQGSCAKSCRCKKSNQVCNSRCHGKKANVNCTNH
jgi:hypothetical protein